jgi:putative glycosyltransferase (TIGR04372 family)
MNKCWKIVYMLFKPYEFICRIICKLLFFFIPIKLIPYRFLGVPYWAFGHLAADCETFVRLRKSRLAPNYIYLLLVLPWRRYNQCLLEHWSPHLIIIRNPLLALLLYPFSRLKHLLFDIHDLVIIKGRQSAFVKMERAFIYTEGTLQLAPYYRARGRSLLKEQFGVKEDDWFVVMHARDSGFNNNNDYYRNSDITTFDLAIKTIVDRGGWCIRIGDSSMNKMETSPQVIDYAHTDCKSDWMDIFLLATCRFMIGANSGPTNVANLFGRPVCSTNTFPTQGWLWGGWRDLCIPKLIMDLREQRILSFEEAITLPYLSTIEFKNNDFGVIDNTSAEINDLVLEMFDHETRGYITLLTDSSPEAKKIRSLFTSNHLCYDSPSSISEHFLSRHRDLIY